MLYEDSRVKLVLLEANLCGSSLIVSWMELF